MDRLHNCYFLFIGNANGKGLHETSFPISEHSYAKFIHISALASACRDGKDCEYKDPVSGETISYDICKQGLKDGKCPPASDKMITSCNIVNYKKDNQAVQCKKCNKNGESCTKDADCCQSTVRSQGTI